MDRRIMHPGVGKGGVNALKTHCQQNHPYDETNTYINPNTGKRLCRECMRRSSLRYYYARRSSKEPMDTDKTDIDWRTTWHAAQIDSPHKGATCRLCGATANKAIHDETFARSRGHEFIVQ